MTIEIEDLTYTYPNQTQPVLRDVNWRVMAGAFVLIAGPSGAGKSTLLRCLNGLVPHFSGGQIAGKVLVNGLDVWAVGPVVMSQQVGFVLQNPEAQAVLDRVEPEIAFGLENAAVSPHLMHQRVKQVMDLLEITHLRARPIHTLSGGERQRVAIASALVLQPNILVLDEPTSQLDPQSAAEVLQAIIRLNKEQGLTIILAEHRLERVLPFADRLVVVEGGEVTLDVAVTEAQRKEIEARGSRGENQKTKGERQALKAERAGEPSREEKDKKEILLVKGVQFAYGGELVLRDVSLTVAAGEAVALMGPNGAGKSTLLKSVVGLLKAQKGETLVNGRSTHNRTVADICREVAYLPQNPDDLLFADSVAEELAITLKNHGNLSGGGRVKMGKLLAELGLSEFSATYPRDLSVGQRQRVALGAVMVTQPPLLLLDEPTRGLDSAAKENLIAIWRRWLERGVGLLLVTHDVELVARTANRIIVLDKGEVIDQGETQTILNHYYPQHGWLKVEDILHMTGNT